MQHICVNTLGHHWFRYCLVACSAPSHYLNQCWLSVSWTPENRVHWNFNRNSIIFIQENAFANVVNQIGGYFVRGYWRKHTSILLVQPWITWVNKPHTNLWLLIQQLVILDCFAAPSATCLGVEQTNVKRSQIKQWAYNTSQWMCTWSVFVVVVCCIIVRFHPYPTGNSMATGTIIWSLQCPWNYPEWCT